MEETIVAPATPPGRGGISIIRISGPSSVVVGKDLCGNLPSPGLLKPCSISNEKRSFVDSGLVVFFKAPHSYTGEDVIEIHCHGNPLIVDSIIEAAVSFGARVAEPGEFTKRAFLNEKIDLAQAESVLDLISAQTFSAVVAANASLVGEFSSLVNKAIDSLIKTRTLVEACLDFSDEDSVEVFSERKKEILSLLEEGSFNLNKLLEGSSVGSKMRDGIRVVILGPPNCGKSTLLNLLAQEKVAIVSDDPGTTRDLLRVSVDVKGVPVEFVDTAGLRGQTSVDVEIEGMKRALAITESSDLVVLMSCVGEAFDANLPTSCKTLRLFNKIDIFSERKREPNAVYMSALTGGGLEDFIESIFSSLGLGVGVEVPVLARRRHISLLHEALGFLDSASGAIDSGVDLVVVAEDLREAQTCLGLITRPLSSDELLGSIFSEFCIGK